MFLSAVPQKKVNPARIQQTLSASNMVSVTIPAKTWRVMSADVPDNVATLVFVITRDYSSAPADTGVTIERVSDGHTVYEATVSDSPNTSEYATLQVSRPYEGWGSLKIYNNTANAGRLIINAWTNTDLYA
ncbi:hypothetical protein NVP1069O_20 [Vibrio phage 1.069.O._10N.286.49.F11]|uniref:Uncharacterized protein n=7 Tax=Autolykiviridae TaxID=2184034 RepID=A0A2I7S882_9VIRU|nr:hypothetical protein KMD65_gp11 [Vibrio phage 1.008.O._10N.286.54.E5]AUR81648.1 hypothetical protein NVP1011O_19 [Vibrio phage 1.011.O._10N.286.49.B11]AUR83787.1 hypothetical protein NVP1040O_20 [Vibrio phage 1.040.O._10N.286.45.B9]AUR84666.1 hypothetical protein NVP1062O_20 [Vibrio phage 1.062.O._10N.286.55.C3]AUR85163.1 hypothetical protein NVP1069O_20 [Vibrio phage 1.069.O._10N.286.49.F11]AUR89591.1 hypothetical protein NVP1125O_20 [Vibrio phage 1.125.O._10N.286.49.F5]AUS02080.1 hypothe